jgi:hypothetical protein
LATAKAGNKAIVIKLLDLRTVLIKYPTDIALFRVVQLEYTATVELLLLTGGVTRRRGKYPFEMAQYEGLDSMAAILESWVVRAAGGGFSESDSN